jgi:hypothetical protein
MKSVMQHAKDNSKHIFNQNVNAAKTFEQNSKELTRAAAQDSASRFNTSVNNSDSGSGSGSVTRTYTTRTGSNTDGTSLSSSSSR